MANKLAKIILTGPLPLQAWNQLRWAPSLGPQIYTLAPFLCRPEIHYGGPHHWGSPKSTHWPLSSAGRKQLWWAPLREAPKINTLAPFLCRPEIILLAPFLCRLKSTWAGPTQQAKIKYHWPHSAGRNKLLLAPLCRPKSTTGGPTLQAENNLLLSQQGHGNTTVYPNRTSMPAILPPAPLQWWPLQ